MLFSPEKISALAPDEESLKRAEKISNKAKWSTAAFDGNFVWGSIKGSALEDYSVIISLEPLSFKCDCPVKVKACKHSLALLMMYAHSKLQFADMPEKVFAWAAKNIKNIQSDSPSKTESSSESAIKEKKKNERLELMRSGLEDLEKWLYDLMAQGLANVAHSNPRFWENSAARFKDSKLSKVAYTIREIADEFNYKVSDYQKIAIKIGELSLLVNTAKNIDHLGAEEQEELLNQLGRLVRKQEVIAAENVMNDLWTVIGQSEQYNLDGLIERKVWLLGNKSLQVALLLDYLFQGDFELKFIVGESFESELYFYSSTIWQRALVNNTEINFSKQHLQYESFKDYEAFFESYARKISLNPWLAVETGIIENLRIVIKSDKPYLADQNLAFFPIRNISSNSLLKLLAISASEPMTYVVTYDNRAFEILSYIREGSICAL
jgi:uncharacterized Zn finger protein